ncbi:hypothetical protein PILCRDRAFT_10956 [Piloderma croceum F 1598]|uniref:Uncharacterized protein n=1 Tax=Piloderma croceum (strain F 1598) TaxID=765440 RepID=A0A0C3BN57_PILCF|nr:hypothetical protein PILCRDRAFT_10956 [Piloderma croceum F 1598]
MSEGTREAGDIVEEANVNRGINAALHNIWSGSHHDDAEEEYNEDEDVEGEEEKDIEGELVEDAYDDGDDDDNALSALDMLGEDFERKSVANAGKLNERNMLILRAYAFKVDEHITDKAFAKIPLAFSKEPVLSVKVCRARLQALSGFEPV